MDILLTLGWSMTGRTDSFAFSNHTVAIDDITGKKDDAVMPNRAVVQSYCEENKNSLHRNSGRVFIGTSAKKCILVTFIPA